jgi:hypothetical protein
MSNVTASGPSAPPLPAAVRLKVLSLPVFPHNCESLFLLHHRYHGRDVDAKFAAAE